MNASAIRVTQLHTHPNNVYATVGNAFPFAYYYFYYPTKVMGWEHCTL